MMKEIEMDEVIIDPYACSPYNKLCIGDLVAFDILKGDPLALLGEVSKIVYYPERELNNVEIHISIPLSGKPKRTKIRNLYFDLNIGKIKKVIFK